MKRLFECRKCHHRFEADDKAASGSYIVCPNCESDDIDYARSGKNGKLLLWCAIGVVVAAGAFLAFKNCGGGDSSEPVVNNEQMPTIVEDTVTIGEDTIPIDPDEIVDLKVVPKVDIKGGKPSFKDGGYTFTVNVKDAPESRKWYVAVLQCDDHTKEVARCDENLHFDKVPPCEKGEYDLGVFDESTKQLLGFSTRSGFVPVKEVAKLAASDLQKLIDTNDDALMGGNKQIAPDCKLHFEGVTDGDVPTALFEIAVKLENGEWKAVKVKKVDHDEMGRVAEVFLSIED